MADAVLSAEHNTILQLFRNAKDGRLVAGPLKKKLDLIARNGSATGSDEAEAETVLAECLRRGLIAVGGGAKDGPHPRIGASYRLTEKGTEALRVPRPDIPSEQLEAQEAFILLQIFRTREQKLTRSELNSKLKTKAAIGQLEFDVKQAPEAIDYHLAMLVEKGCLDEKRVGSSVSYTLIPDFGTKTLASMKQHDAVIFFQISGETLNTLLSAARHSKPPEERLPTPAAEPARSEPLNSQHIITYIAELRSNKFAGTDRVPVHEVRRLVAQHLGDQAARHSHFDDIVKQMRSEGQLRLLAISDSRDATQIELDDSIPGVNETLFYMVIRQESVDAVR